jgi:hypothetical protein
VVRVPRLRIGAKPPKRYQRRRSGHDQALDRLAAAFATLGLRWLHRLIGREELRDLAVGQIALSSSLGSPRTSPGELTIARTAADTSLRLAACSIAASESRYRSMTTHSDWSTEVGVILQRSGVLGPHELHRLSGQALVFVDLALMDLEPSDTQKLTQCSVSILLQSHPVS